MYYLGDKKFEREADLIYQGKHYYVHQNCIKRLRKNAE
jgi:hypothetical protein